MTPHKTLAIVSGLAIAAAHPEPSIWPLGWVGLVPLLYAIRGKTPRRSFFLGWLAGMALYLPLLYWIAPTISNFTKIPSWQAGGILVLLCIVLAFAIGAFAALVEWLAQAGISRVLAAPIVWVCIEWLRSYYPAPCPWALLGYSQYEVRTVIQIADLGAVYLVSGVLVFMNAAIAEIVRAGWRGRPLLVTAFVGVPILVVGYGVLRLAAIDSYEGGTTVHVGVAQANIPQDQKWDREYQDSTMATYLRLSREAAAAGAELIVWPEASVPFFVPQDPRSAELERLAQETGAELFVGTPGYERTETGGRHYNRAWQILPDRGLAAH
jgi:apolipoprotein N-acyltransferase